MDALLTQSTKPNEIVVVDSNSTDKTGEILKHFQKRDRRIRVLTQGSTRAEARNLSVEIAINDLILMTDAGCVPDKDWVKNLTKPFRNEDVDMVAGFYKMTKESEFQKAASVYLGTQPRDFNMNFLPSTRSVAFRRSLWRKIGGFPEKLKDTAEDTVFNYKAVDSKAKIARVKDAVVEWGMPTTSKEFFKKIFRYAKGDAQTKLFWNPSKRLSSHNIKAIFVLLRYMAGFALLLLALKSPLLWYLVGFSLIFYIFWAFRKVYSYERNLKAALWGVVLQFTADFAVMYGFLRGIIGR